MGIEVEPGEDRIISSAVLSAHDNDTSSTNIIYVFESVPIHGLLQIKVRAHERRFLSLHFIWTTIWLLLMSLQYDINRKRFVLFPTIIVWCYITMLFFFWNANDVCHHIIIQLCRLLWCLLRQAWTGGHCQQEWTVPRKLWIWTYCAMYTQLSLELTHKTFSPFIYRMAGTVPLHNTSTSRSKS